MTDTKPDDDVYFLIVKTKLGDDVFPTDSIAEIALLIPSFYQYPMQVTKGNLAAGTYTDVSEDVADFMADALDNYDSVPDFVMVHSSKIQMIIDDDANDLEWDRKHVAQEKMH